MKIFLAPVLVGLLLGACAADRPRPIEIKGPLVDGPVADASPARRTAPSNTTETDYRIDKLENSVQQLKDTLSAPPAPQGH